MEQSASFSSLPPELVSKICSHSNLDKKDLTALRLTSKVQGIHASATKAFAKRYFADVLLLWDQYSFATFVEICQHPVFGPSIHRVQLSCAHFDHDRFYDLVDELRSKGYDHRKFSGLIQRLSQRCDDAQNFFDARALLNRAFVHLGESDRSFVLTVSTNEDLSLGRSKTWVSDMRSNIWAADLYSSMIYLIDAADKGACRIRKIEMDIETIEGCNFYCPEDLTDRWKESKSVHSLVELTLDLRIAHETIYDKSDISLILVLLSLTVNLKTLHLRADIFTRQKPMFKALTQSISRLSLEELHLSGLYMRQDTMAVLLESLGSTLCRLRVLDCHVNGQWKEILLSMQQHALRLDELHIGGIERSWLPEMMVCKGVTEVRSGIAGLLRARDDIYHGNNRDG